MKLQHIALLLLALVTIATAIEVKDAALNVTEAPKTKRDIA
jgi:hypothetical protein